MGISGEIGFLTTVTSQARRDIVASDTSMFVLTQNPSTSTRSGGITASLHHVTRLLIHPKNATLMVRVISTEALRIWEA